jgi:hypothetical protein
LGYYFFQVPITSAISYDPALTWLPSPYNYYYLPGWYYQGDDHNNLGSWFNGDAYTGNLFILVNELTLSQAEYTCQYLSYHPSAKVFGTQTAGADGNVSYLTLPSGMTTYFTSLGWYYSDGYQQQRNGVKIDTVVSPTPEGIRQGKDEILLAALDCVTRVPGLDLAWSEVLVYPNPVTDQVLHFSLVLAGRSNVTAALYSMTGDVISERTYRGASGKNQFDLDLPNIAAGLYLLKVQNGNKLSGFKVIVN